MSVFNRNASFKRTYGTHSMGFGFSFGGSKGSSSSSFNETSEEEVKKSETGLTTSEGTAKTSKDTLGTTDSTQTSGQKTETLADQLSVVSQLDEETQLLISNLLGSLAGGTGEVATAQQERALGAEDRLAGITGDIVASAEAKGEEQVGQTVQALSRQAGSSQNSIVQQLGLQESARVDREVADLAATLGIQVDQLVSGELGAAVSGQGDLIAKLSDVLKGAEQTATTTTKETGTTDLITQLQEIIAQSETGAQETKTTEEALIESLSAGTKTASGTGTGKSREKGGGLSFSL